MNILPEKIAQVCDSLGDRIPIYELRLRAGKPLIIDTSKGEYVDKYIVTVRDIKETLDRISKYSLYAYENELKDGYITIAGGNRVGICGRTVCNIDRIVTIKNISSLNVRYARQIIGCSNKYMPIIYDSDNIIHHTLIISAPGRGKTTLLRDIIRNLSNGFDGRRGVNVSVVDERSEIAAMCEGICQNDVGIRTDVLDACPKAEGILILLRTMNPRVIAVDEIGGIEDIKAVNYAMKCGCSIIATVHAISYDEIMQKKLDFFERYIFLQSGEVMNQEGQLYELHS